jgi:hypothetical protein
MDTSNIKHYRVMLNDIEQWNTSGELHKYSQQGH